jgi:hypothetical protein
VIMVTVWTGFTLAKRAMWGAIGSLYAKPPFVFLAWIHVLSDGFCPQVMAFEIFLQVLCS